MNDHAEKTIFVGYTHGGYKLFNPITKKVILSRDVTFAEDEAWNWDAYEQQHDSWKHATLGEKQEDVSTTVFSPTNEEVSSILAQENSTMPTLEELGRPRRQ